MLNIKFFSSVPMWLSRRLMCRSIESTRQFIAAPIELLRLVKVPEDAPSDLKPDLASIISVSERLHGMQLRRVELLSLPASSVSVRNKELVSLAVGALSGALSLSVHPGFALIFIVSYRMYRKARRPTEMRLESQSSTVQELDKEIREIVRERGALIEKIKQGLGDDLE
jgi:hypothetical protein